jgi:hypothetical protein
LGELGLGAGEKKKSEEKEKSGFHGFWGFYRFLNVIIKNLGFRTNEIIVII